MSIRGLLCLITALSALLLAPCPLAALKTFLEPRLVDELDTVRLTIRAEGSGQSEAPDLTPLMKDFEVLGSQTSSRISSINGRTTASVEYQISLQPRRTGELRVPSLSIGGEQSESILIRVRPLDPSVKQTIASRVFFETELSRNPVYVQAETVLSRRLFYSQGVQIYSDLPGVPEIEGAVVIPLGETQSRSVLRAGRRYGVIEQRFALFPERSGPMTIPAISVTSSVQLQAQGRTRRSGIRVSTEEITLNVLPIPDIYPADAAWLPATGVSVNQRWTPAEQRVNVGDPLTFEVSVRVEGNRGSAIPPVLLPLPTDRFKIYPAAPEMAESADTGAVVGIRQARYALIPTAPGPLAVPDLTVTWWDTEADRLRQARAAVAPLDIIGPPPPVTPEPAAGELPVTVDEPAPDTAAKVRFAWPPWQALLTAGLGAVLLIVLPAWAGWLLFRNRQRLTSRFPVLDRSAARERRQHLKAMRAATRQGRLSNYRQALGAYLASVYDAPAGAAVQCFRAQPGAAALLGQLDRAVYARSAAGGPAAQPAGEPAAAPDLISLTALARATAQRQRGSRGTNELPGLYD